MIDVKDAGVLRLRRAAASIVGVLAMAPLFYELRRDLPWSAMLPITAPLLAAVLIQMHRLGPQLGARAIWWANHVLGVILAALGNGNEQSTSLPIAWGSGIALLLVGRTSVATAAAQGGFAPSKFQNALLVLMILALADAQMLALFGMVNADRYRGDGTVLVLLGGALFVGFLLLLRLKLAGLFVNVAACVLTMLVVGTKMVRVDNDTRAPILVLVTLHVLVAAPVLGSALTGRSLPALPPRVAGRVGGAVVIAAVLLATVAALFAKTY